MKMSITVTFTLLGCHRYPEAKRSDIRKRHMHPFQFSVVIPVFHADREIEWLELRDYLIRNLKAEFGERLLEFGTLSCEAICIALAKILVNRVNDRAFSVSVAESDEGCIAFVQFTKKDVQKLAKQVGVEVV